MAGNIDNPSEWRLRTTGGIPYKFLGISGDFSEENASVTWRALIQSSQFIAFAIELFPPPIRIGDLEVPRTAPLPGLPTMSARKIRFKSQDSGMPIDPFNSDPTAPTSPHSTYYPVVEIAVDFGPNMMEGEDPQTFLEISANATGEFINSHMPGGKWSPKSESQNVDPIVNTKTGEVTFPPGFTDQRTDVEVRDRNVPVIVKVPLTEWTIRYPRMRYEFFRDVMIHRMRYVMGRVNSASFGLLYDAYPETLLFDGFTLKEEYTWREEDYTIGKPPVTVEMKIQEKRALWNGRIRGHNDFWRPGVGWETLLINGSSKAYESADFDLLFQV